MFPPVNARVPKRLWGCSYKAVAEGSTPSSSILAPSPSGSRHRTLTPAYVVGSNPTGAVYKKKGENIMTNLEFIQTCSKDELIRLLCNEIAPTYHCENCVASEHCYFEHNGFIDWLDEEHEK